jgi:hypothetical protein
MTQQTGAAPAPDPKEKKVIVTLTENPKAITVVPETVRLHKFEKHTATWESPQGQTFEIHFDPADTPFQGHHFNHQTAKQLGVHPDIPNNAQKTYKYTVRAPGYPDLDPGVIVEP